MRLEEYSEHLKSDSPTIEFSTEHGKTIVCRKQAHEIEDLLKSAKELLQNMVEAENVPTIEAIHRLRDLATVLDQLKLQEECLVVGDCAIKLAQALGLRSVKFQMVTAQTITLIAALDVYKSQMRPLFIQAISICEASVIEDESDSAKRILLTVLTYASAHAEDHPALCAQWLGRAVDLIAELPAAMVIDEVRILVYGPYGMSLCKLEQYSKALAAKEQEVAVLRSLASKYDGPHYKENLARALGGYGSMLRRMGRHVNALSVDHEAVSLLRALVVCGQEKQKMQLAATLLNHGHTLYEMGRLEDALTFQRETISLYRTLVVQGEKEPKEMLAFALQSCGYIFSEMGRLEDAISVQQEAVSLLRALVTHGEEQKVHLAGALLKYGYTLNEMDRLEDALTIQRETISLYRALVVHGEEKQKEMLAAALWICGNTFSKMGRLEDALSVQQEADSLGRAFATHREEQKVLNMRMYYENCWILLLWTLMFIVTWLGISFFSHHASIGGQMTYPFAYHI